MYKFNLIKSEKGYRVQFAYNSTIIFWTETYSSKANAMNAIESFKEHGTAAEIVEVEE